MAQIIPINFIVFLILLSFIKAEKNILRFTLRDDNGNAIVLNWQKTEQLLANEHTPLWLARHGVTADAINLELLPDFISSNFGNIIMYRDIRKSSAVVYLPRSNILLGNIGDKYIIDGLPLKELKREHLLRGSRYVKRRLHTTGSRACRIDYQSTYNQRMKGDESDGNQVTRLYPEILIFITNDILWDARRMMPLNPLAFLVAEILSYFNTISLSFDRLSTEHVKVHINIAGIIVEDHTDAFPFTRPAFIGDDKADIDAKNTLLFSVPQYLRRSGFSNDSFDFFFIATGYPVRNPVKVSGFATPQFHMYEMRSTQGFSEPRFLGAIADYSEDYASHVEAVQRIAWLMSIEDKTQSLYVEWSKTNERELLKYARENRNRCFLLNYPRSLMPYGYPMSTISPSNQCICYGYVSGIQGVDEVGETACNQKLMCKHQTDNSDVNNTPLPIDGTPCNVDKVCWNQQCQNV